MSNGASRAPTRGVRAHNGLRMWAWRRGSTKPRRPTQVKPRWLPKQAFKDAEVAEYPRYTQVDLSLCCCACSRRPSSDRSSRKTRKCPDWCCCPLSGLLSCYIRLIKHARLNEARDRASNKWSHVATTTQDRYSVKTHTSVVSTSKVRAQASPTVENPRELPPVCLCCRPVSLSSKCAGMHVWPRAASKPQSTNAHSTTTDVHA
jgi:hypothetical protein